MNTGTGHSASLSSRGFLAPILAGGILAGAIDLTFACTYNGLMNGTPPLRILQAIASGWLGMDAFQNVYPAAVIGFLSHFGILIVAAAMYYAASRRLLVLREHAYLSGIAFGIAIYATMHLIVLPLSAAPPFKPSWIGRISDFSVHMLLLGPAIALVVRHFDRRVAR
jgi:uncharacterized membrane protein YagU involved in acid resistance